MKSKILNTSNFWEKNLLELVQSKSSPSIDKLNQAGILTTKDLLWILPLRIFKTPKIQNYNQMIVGEYFLGNAKVLNLTFQPQFYRKMKGKMLLHNATMVVQDSSSSQQIKLRWFNIYPNQKKKIQTLNSFQFLGEVTIYQGQKQIVNPQIVEHADSLDAFIIDYPTLNKVSGTIIKKIIDLIPPEYYLTYPQQISDLPRNFKMSLGESFKILHGKIPSEEFTKEISRKAKERLAYEEFLEDQLKILTRREFHKKKKSLPISISNDLKNLNLKKISFELTADQLNVLKECESDILSGTPMMRLIQGDVGCGKTVVALFLSSYFVSQNRQVAIMCPTESLALQHYDSFREFFGDNINIGLLLGSLKAKEKSLIQKNIAAGEIQIVIGTHSLIQENVSFKNLGFAVIDEQHKFGVDQRLKLIAKGLATHCLIMSATPIPRTLSLAHYGDLSISTIKTMPPGRKPTKTRITEKINYEKYLSFLRQKLQNGEQAYFVFPLIEESEKLDLKNVLQEFDNYKLKLKPFNIGMLHGKMKPSEKEKILDEFKKNTIQVLISTSVIEVGINIPNASIMSIYHPERFGLSSLHQLRGRVGRGTKQGYCFLVLTKDLSQEAMTRLSILESTNDGFLIAEEDLKFRGEGDLFGVDQSGTITRKKVASFIDHAHILEQVIQDLNQFKLENPQKVSALLELFAREQKVTETV